MRKNNKILIVIIGTLLLAGIVLVFIVTGRSQGPEQIVKLSEPIGDILTATTEVPGTEISEATEPTQSEVVEDQVVATPKSGLESTDPSTVNLASGKIQLVEIFAFW